MKLKFIFSLILASFFVFGCDLANSNDEIDEIKLTEKTAQLLEAENSFGFELFQNIYAFETQSDNIMVSPLSVSLALAMTYNGANGETKTAMEKTLKVYGLTSEAINTSYQTLVDGLKSLDKKVLLEIANAIYYREGFDVEQDFISTNKEYYNAEVDALDFSSPNALETINGWVAEKTHDKIDKILDEISPEQVMFLINAIYFKGMWASEFDKDKTTEDPFYPDSGSTIQTDFMNQTQTVEMASNDLFSAIQLPYGKGKYNMFVFLPETDKTLQDIVDKLDKDNWETWMQSFAETEDVIISLPKFKYKYEIKLNDVLSEMGMGVAFTDAADFTGINKNGQLKIDFVKHKTFIEVNEEGTEAAAVTVVGVETTSVPLFVEFNANRPFFYAITEKDTGAILFMGTVKNPVYE
ncbi:serpin family protein [Maribellus comscasis]|uniref:Serpin family protein n=1 Tax=Maribellus comscasis TaxID=2681766 RepID=A0A6I6JV74_9BACT|nr:serpin family protein [Maribellus comscasis]QGY45179.1 serpin family protein [Maribellus comscasis]